jgi:hypothetical protein
MLLTVTHIRSQTVTEVSNIVIPSGKVVSEFAVLEKEDSTESTFYLIVDDPGIYNTNGGVTSSSSLDSQLSLKCYRSSTKCLTAGNLKVLLGEYTGTEFDVGKKPYKFLKEFK